VEPGRTEGGHRLYSDADVEHLRLLHELTLGGRQIGQIADRSTDELRALLREDRAAEARAPSPDAPTSADSEDVRQFLTRAYDAVEAIDSPELSAVLRRGALSLSTPTFLDDLLVPLMARIGQAWADRELRPAHEHAASAVVMLGALAAAVTAASEGWRVRYLGPDLPAEDVALAVADADARAVALSLVFPAGDQDVVGELRKLRTRIPETLPVLVGGASAGSYDAVLREIDAVRIDGFASLRSVLRHLRREGQNAVPASVPPGSDVPEDPASP